MNRLIFVFAICLCLTVDNAISQDGTDCDLSSPFTSIDPDSYSIVLSKQGNKWNNKIGAGYDLEIICKQRYNLRFLLGGFVNIHDFSTQQAFSWQLWRGNVGAGLEYKIKSPIWFSKISYLTTEISWHHESQHVTDLIGYTQEFTNITPEEFNNGGIRSFEYYKLSITYVCNVITDKYRLAVSTGYKYFPAPELDNTRKMLLSSVYLETGIERNISKDWHLYTSFFFESLRNCFISEEWKYRGNWNKEPLKFNILECGFTYRKVEGPSIGVFVDYSSSNGRGLDFPMYAKTFGAGLRMEL